MQVNKTDSSSIDFLIVLISYKHDDFFSDALNSITNQIYDKSGSRSPNLPAINLKTKKMTCI